MWYRINRKIKDKSAQALPEFALCLPLIMLMIGILITVGQMVYAKEVLQAAAQSYCRAFVTSYTVNIADKMPDWLLEQIGEDAANQTSDAINEAKANKNGIEQAELIMDNAAMNIMLLNPNGGDQPTYDYAVKPITGNTTSEDGGLPREILNAKGKNYNYVEVRVYGAIETLFPVQWNGNTLTPNLTFLQSYCAMIIEKK